jgi:hypothetical protein
MDFEFSPKVKDLQQRVGAFMDEHVYPNEARFHEEIAANRRAGNAWVPTRVVEELKEKARAQGLWNLWLPESEFGAGLAARSWAARPSARSPSTAPPPIPATWRRSFATAAPSTRSAGCAAARGRDPLLLRHDGARRRLVGRDQHPHLDRARRRQLRHQRAQMVDLRRDGPALRIAILMGKTDPERREAQAAIDDPRADGHAGRHRRARAHGLRLRRRAPRPCGGEFRERPRAGLQHPARRRPRLRDRAGAARAGPHPPLHALDRRRRARARDHVQAGAGARGLRARHRRSRRHAPLDRRIAHGDRPGAAAHAARGADDGRGRQQGGAGRDRHDQGGRPEHGAEGDRSRHPVCGGGGVRAEPSWSCATRWSW